MQPQPLLRSTTRHFLPDHHDVFRPIGQQLPILEWEGDAGDDLLFLDGQPIARVLCRGRHWFLSITDSARPYLRTGSRAEARQLAVFYALRTHR